MQVLRYLGRYTHRVAISNHRLLAFDQERVTFRWKDYAHGGKQGQMTLAATEFLRRFFLHVLPKRLRPHPSLRLSGQSLSRIPLGAIPTTAGLQLLDASKKLEHRDASLREFFSLALPTLRRDHDRDSEIYCCGIINMHLTSIRRSASITTRRLDVLRHADAFVCSPHVDTPRSQPSAHTLACHLRHSQPSPFTPASPVVSRHSTLLIQTAVQIP